MKKQRIAIFGIGSIGRLVHNFSSSSDIYEVECFVVDDEYKSGSTFLDLPLFTWNEFLEKFNQAKIPIFLAMGYHRPYLKSNISARFDKYNIRQINLIFSQLILGDIDFSGLGNLIMPNVCIEPGVAIGCGNIFWSGSHVCHDTVIGDYNFFASKTVVGGETIIGNQNFFGFSTTVIERINIRERVKIGASSLVIRDIKNQGVYVGAPVHKLK